MTNFVKIAIWRHFDLIILGFLEEKKNDIWKCFKIFWFSLRIWTSFLFLEISEENLKKIFKCLKIFHLLKFERVYYFFRSVYCRIGNFWNFRWKLKKKGFFECLKIFWLSLRILKEFLFLKNVYCWKAKIAVISFLLCKSIEGIEMLDLRDLI